MLKQGIIHTVYFDYLVIALVVGRCFGLHESPNGSTFYGVSDYQ